MNAVATDGLMKRHRWAVLGVLLLVNALAYMDRTLLVAFSPQITHELKLDDTQFGLLVGMVWVLSYGLMALALGSLADRYSRPKVIAGGIFVWSLCTAASGLVHSYEQMIAARLLVATGEAALVPAATALLSDLFDDRRGTALGIFFMGLPLGAGLAFVLSGTVGTAIGWRGTYLMLGGIGMLIPLAFAFVKDERPGASHRQLGQAPVFQLRELFKALAVRPAVRLAIVGFVLAHVVFASGAYIQLWLVREHGADAARIAREIGIFQIVFGCLGAAVGGFLGDRLAARFGFGHATFPILAGLVCVPLIIAGHLSAPGDLMFYPGLAAYFFLPLSLYGSSVTIIQGEMPIRMRATVTGLTMLCLNVVAIALGTLVAGAASDYLGQSGYRAPLTAVMLAGDVVIGSAFLFFLLAGRSIARERAGSAIRT